jgi:hypothetical protein
VDHQAAAEAAKLLSEINQGCSDASSMRSAALTLPVFFLLRFVPLFGMLGLVGFYGLMIAIPIWAMRWWFRFGGIVARDADFDRARKTVKTVGIVVAVLLVVLIIGPFLLGFFRALSH